MGCGLDLQRREVFYTLNGAFVGVAFRGVSVARALFPAVGVDSLADLACNFGAAPFAFDLRAHLAQRAEPR